MCGIFGIIGNREEKEAQTLSKRMSHRGPDERGLHISQNGSILLHERLSIIDLSTGKQPIKGSNNAYVIHNGEIYNHQELRSELSHHTFNTNSDSEIIVHLYEEYGTDFLNKLDGVFVFVILEGDFFMAARDPIGVKPLYYGTDKNGNMYFASEMKVITDQCDDFKAFPPGHYYTEKEGFVKYYKPEWEDHSKATKKVDLKEIRESLTAATKKRLMSDVPLGVLLSGGLDSSIISSITKRALTEMGIDELHSFSIGTGANAPDLLAAKKVAKHIGTKHHEIYFSVEQGIEAIEKIIWHLETYDVTTIRASTPMYFLSKAITDMGIKVVLSGEGADEIFGGYLYFYNAPSNAEFQKETVSRVQRLSTADCLRADKSTMAHGLEARVPFLDKEFIDVTMKIDPQDKKPNKHTDRPEKYILRKAFDDKENPYIPESVLWRQKEQFSDGVGYSWIDGLTNYCNSVVSDNEFSRASELYKHNTPTTKEAFLFRKIFEKHYPQKSAIESVVKWIPKWQFNIDPSGRACDVHLENYTIKKEKQRLRSA